MYSVILCLTKQWYAMTKIHHGLKQNQIPYIQKIQHWNSFIAIEITNSFTKRQTNILQDHLITSIDAYNKAHGHNNISICMLEICSPTILEPLEIIFSEALSIGCFHQNGKKEASFLSKKIRW